METTKAFVKFDYFKLFRTRDCKASLDLRDVKNDRTTGYMSSLASYFTDNSQSQAYYLNSLFDQKKSFSRIYNLYMDLDREFNVIKFDPS